ncbi:predicted protein [Chaetoceros tenuissimus]|uniref:Uncharacterized protein n=1 Tax=Chaetoceros tenuissimus TaxID=426638 RepID=A0AAD3D2W4_9STRA|nr:predicted protein [Chaetoceros tenuissimus]
MSAAGSSSIQSIGSSASNRSKIEELRKKRLEITKKKNRLPSYQKSYSMESEDMSVGSLQSMVSSASSRSRIEELRKKRMEITKRKNRLQSSIHSSPRLYKSYSMESDDDSFVSRQSLGSPTNYGIPISISLQTQSSGVTALSDHLLCDSNAASDTSNSSVYKNGNKHETMSEEVKGKCKQSSDTSVCGSLSGKEVLRFGKYKGKTYWHVLQNDSTYSYITMVDSEQSDNPDIIHFGKWVKDHLAFYCGCKYKDVS